MNIYFKISLWATNLHKWLDGFCAKPYICVTRSLTISFLISGVSFCSFIALIIDGRHLLGILKPSGRLDPGLLEIETVDGIDGLGEEHCGDAVGVSTVCCCGSSSVTGES